MKKLIGLLAVLFVGIALTGCEKNNDLVNGLFNGLESDQILKIDETILTSGQAAIALEKEKSRYEDYYGTDIWDEKIGDITAEEYLKELVINDLSIDYGIASMAEEYDIVLTDEEKETADTEAKQYMDNLSSTTLCETEVTVDDAIMLYEVRALSDKVFTELTNDKLSEISDENARIIQVQYICIHVTEEQSKEDAQKKIEDVYEMVLAGNQDFINLVEKYSEQTSEIETISKEDKSEKFTDAAFSLSNDEISEIVFDNDAFYIIKCINNYMEDETIENKERMEDEAREFYFQNKYEEYLESVKTLFNEEAWDRIKF